MKKSVLIAIILILVVALGILIVPVVILKTTETEAEVKTTAIVIEITEVVSEAETETETEAATAEETTTEAEATTIAEVVTEERTSEQSFTEIDLSISMPEQNGTMVTDTKKDNKYIKIVCDKRDVYSELLVAVYSVPDSGQNYVFEFYDSENFSADNIRRVYLIDEKGNIVSVAAAKTTEKENITVLENWFCMNVLIKEIVFPAVENDLS